MSNLNKVLKTRRFLYIFSCTTLALLAIECGGVSHSATPHHIDASNTISVTAYLRYFDSSSIAALTESTLKEAYDVNFTLSNKDEIGRIEKEINSMRCEKPGKVDVSDLRALLEFKNSEGVVHTWRASYFYYENWHGGICKLQPADRVDLESLLLELGGSNDPGLKRH